MTEPLNYTPTAIIDLKRLAAAPAISKVDREGVLFLVELLRRAEVFVLPEAGELMDRSKPRPEVPGDVYRPAFPVMALEYRSAMRSFDDPVYSAVDCTKRIALIWEWDGIMPGGGIDPNGPKLGEGAVVASISFVDRIQQWVPVVAGIMVPFDGSYIDVVPNEASDAMLACGRLTSKHLKARQIEPRGMLPFLPDAMDTVARQHGARSLMMISTDLMDEVGSYLDLCLALACNNVSTERHEAPARLNKRRIAGGKPPLKDFHVLQIAGHGEGEGFAGAGDGVRSHLRRGHIRRLGPERITWVNATMVQGRRPGFVDKIYAPKGARA